MTSKTWPFPEGAPEKFGDIESDPIANEEWGRICGVLAARRMLSPAWGGMILLAATALSELRALESVMARHGRTEEFAELHAAFVNHHLAACRDLTVSAHPSVVLTCLKGDRAWPADDRSPLH